MMRKGGESPEEEKARFGVSREFAKRVKEILGDAPDIVFEHVGQATFPTSVFTVKPFGKVVICAGTTGFNLDFDVRYLWMKQKEILGSHFANAYECMKANELIESGQIRPVLWRTLGFDGVAEAHQLMLENKHLGKISILVGADAEGQGKTRRGPRRDPRGGGRLMAGTVIVPWYATGFRADDFELALNEVARRGAALRRELLRRLPRARRPLPLPAARRPSRTTSTGNATGTAREMTDFRATPLQLVPGAGALRLVGSAPPRRHRRARERARGTAGGATATATAVVQTARHRRRRERLSSPRSVAQPCSSGAIVRPAPFSCSQ